MDGCALRGWVPHFSRSLREVGLFAETIDYPACISQLDRLHNGRRVPDLRFRDQEMEVLRHYNVPHDHKAITLSHGLKHGEEKISSCGGAKHGLTAIAAARDEVQAARAVIALQSPWHVLSVRSDETVRL